MSTKVNNAVIFETVVSKDAAVCFLKKKKGKKNKTRMKKEGNQLTTNCRQLKMIAEDGKRRETDMADTEQLLCIIYSPFRHQKPNHSKCGSLRLDVSG